MKFKMHLLLISFFYFIFLCPLNSQFNQTTPLSQNTNYYIKTISDGRTFIGSVDGLNIFDGEHTKVYKPSTHNMFGNNIQSDFYEDLDGDIWFGTYQSLNVYRKNFDSINSILLNIDQETFNSDYRIIDLIGDSLFITTNFIGLIFNVKSENLEGTFKIPPINFDKFKLISTKYGYTLVALDEEASYFVKYDKDFKYQTSTELPIKGTDVSMNNNDALVTSVSGDLFILNTKKEIVETKIKLSDKRLLSIERLNDSIYLITSPNKVIEFNFRSKQKVSHNIYEDQLDREISNYNTIRINKDSILWLGVEGKGVFFKDLKHSSFSRWPYDNTNLSITGIHEIVRSNKFIVTTRLSGIYIIDGNGFILDHQLDINDSLKRFTVLDGCIVDNENFLFNSFGNVVLFDLKSYNLKQLISAQNQSADYFVSPTQMSNGRIITSTYSEFLYEVVIKNEYYKLIPYKLNWIKQPITSIKHISDQIYAISINEEKISITEYDPKVNDFSKISDLDITGGVRSICPIDDTLFYISNVNGLFEINLSSYTFNQINGPSNEFNQTIYAVIKDNSGLFWMSTNQGILSFDKRRNKVRKYSKADGLQGLEYNSNAYHIADQGIIYFGGVNGLNYFDPTDMKASTDEVPVFLTEYRINDFTTESQGISMTLESIRLPYTENTITFLFHALDYKDPQATRVKYKLSGEDRDFVESETAQGLARYANLSPGKYTFTIIGANADGHWNESKKEINFEIIPPIWQRWWFRLISILIIVGIVFKGVRFYYNQKLKQKDFALREQALIIEKQQALQNERTRIAGEMHDDLGGGLTSIGYLSQKIIRSLDNEEQKSQVNKIINHAQTLVNNMSEIIWAMNSGFDTLDSLIAYCRRYSRAYLDDNDLELEFAVFGDTKDIAISGEKRRNIYLIIKEALNNVVKHANASIVNLEFDLKETLIITVQDNGKGLPNQESLLGNGLSNIKKRVNTLGGQISINDKSPGLEIVITLPISS